MLRRYDDEPIVCYDMVIKNDDKYAYAQINNEIAFANFTLQYHEKEWDMDRNDVKVGNSKYDAQKIKASNMRP